MKLEKLKLEQVLHLQENEKFRKQSAVFELPNGYQGKKEIICIDFINKNVDIINTLTIGHTYDVSINLSSREYQGKYYHNVTAWKVDEVSEVDNKAVIATKNDITPQDNNPDLPF